MSKTLPLIEQNSSFIDKCLINRRILLYYIPSLWMNISVGWYASYYLWFSLFHLLFVFYVLFKTHEINYKRLHNHVILVLLICNFILITTKLPITLVYTDYGHGQPENDRFCSFWVAYNYVLFDIGLYRTAFASIERYFLIFHEAFVRKGCIIVHYLPVVIGVIYPLMY